MNIVADESIDRQIVDRLRSEGHQVLFIAELYPGISDAEVLARSREHEALLLTADRDFGELVFRQHLLHAGVFPSVWPACIRTPKAALVAAQIHAHASELCNGFAVLSDRALGLRRQRS
ncbi:MAG TPA: DUF5615 family PIN-like protein [Bryobacteraceae bacterium]|nr:DUF5615 family PIN-like protein [Bryobacteraceae bacterium]